MNRFFRKVTVATFALFAASQSSCKLNDYCLECEKGDGGGGSNDGKMIDASIDAPDAGPCTPSGPEICDGIDNDCNGLVDDGVLPEVGDDCTLQLGECSGGKKVCAPTFHCSVTIATACFDANDTISCPSSETCKADAKSTDHLTCDKHPVPELCDGKDNNCNGTIDEGDPGDLVNAAGARCGNGNGTCVQGVYHCTGSCVNQADGCAAGTDTMMCQGGIAPGTEVCDGQDNDCDGTIDDNLPNLGTCGASGVGVCKTGNNTCVGGNVVCQGAVNPGIESCNTLDDDCDGKTDEDFKGAGGVYNQSTQNCGGCNMVCGAGLTNGGNANWTCAANGTCQIASCKSGYHDNNTDPSDGCEFGVCFTSGAEQCDGVDNDCDGVIDEAAGIGTAPAICATQGECKGTVAACPCANTADTNCTNGGTCVTTCATMTGWSCDYPATVSLDANGNIVSETKCDNLDEDCNGIIDDAQAQMKHADCAAYAPGDDTKCPYTGPACDDGKLGTCRSTGHYTCDTPNTNPAKCTITTVGGSPTAESCNNADDDCDGVTDEGSSTGSLDGTGHNDQLWIDIGGGHQMMPFEASRPDASGTSAGITSASTCTKETIAASPTGATESGTTVTLTTNVSHGVKTGDRVTVAGAGVAGYNGTFVVTGTPSATTLTYTTTAGLAASGGGTISIHCPMTITAASESGSVATYTTSVAHNFSVGSAVIIAGVGVSGYNGTAVITAVPTTTTFSVNLASSGLAGSSGGTAATNGVATCSKSGALPWTNVTYPQALAACQAIGATLCSESEWHRSCSANATGGNLPTVYPVSTTGTGLLIEAEDYFQSSYATDSGGTTRSWVEDQTAGFFGVGDMLAQTNSGGSISAANAPTQSPRLDYKVTFTAGANYHVCVHMNSATTSDNEIYVGINAALPGTANATSLATTANNAWQWISSPVFNLSAGTQFVSLYMKEDGVKVDALYIINGTCPGTLTTTNEAGTVNGKGFQWAMQPTPSYTSNVCNDQNYTGTGNGAALTTGKLASCYADDSGLKSGSTAQKAFDMAGNIKEWALAHQPGENPIRGGSFNDTSVGVDCPLNFLLADDKFFLPNVGFRCCR